jgi:Zn-dependent peptidase ImmA (M78 family)
MVDHEEHRYDPDEKASWGSFTLWVDGVNITEHNEVGEYVRSAHWYLLPLIEWFVVSWDDLLHEERLPLRNAGQDAATGMTKLLIQSLGMVRPDLDEFARYEKWQDWWSRHCIGQAASGGLFPDVYLRRWGDLVEVSVGTKRSAGTPDHFYFRNVGIAHFVPVDAVATALHDVLGRAVAELRRRRPNSPRLKELEQAWSDLDDSAGVRYAGRLARLSGVDTADAEATERFHSLWSQVDDMFVDGLEGDFRSELVGAPGTGLVLESSPQLALLFGSYSPSISADDVQTLLRSFHGSLKHAEPHDLPNLDDSYDMTLTPGEQGSVLGEIAYRKLVDTQSSFVDVDKFLQELKVRVTEASLTDGNTRAVTIMSARFGAHIIVNSNYIRGTSERVRRFTLAHELGHILLDRARSARFAIASGPWAPVAIEKRANAFAAAFLMPESLVERTSVSIGAFGSLASPLLAGQLAETLNVSLSSLAERMYNLMLVSREEADIIRESTM